MAEDDADLGAECLDAKTSLTTDAKAGATKLDVASSAGFSEGRTIKLHGVAGSESELCVIAGFGSILLASPLRFVHPIGTVIEQLPKDVVERLSKAKAATSEVADGVQPAELAVADAAADEKAAEPVVAKMDRVGVQLDLPSESNVFDEIAMTPRTRAAKADIAREMEDARKMMQQAREIRDKAQQEVDQRVAEQVKAMKDMFERELLEATHGGGTQQLSASDRPSSSLSKQA